MHILFDIGKTKTRMAGSLDLVSFSEARIFDTPKSYEEFLETVRKVSGEISGGEKISNKIEMAGGGVGVPIEKETGVLHLHPEIPDWENRPLKDDLAKIFGAPVILENDSAIVGLGEAVHGAGRGSDIVAYITVSTGVGGSRIVDGKVDRSAMGFEPGHQFVSLLGEAVYAEDIFSGTAVEKMTGKKPREILDKDFWDEKAKVLAHFLNNVIVMWSPDVVVLGGSMMNEIGIPIPATEKYLKEVCKIFPTLPPLKHSELGDLGGLWGAMELLRQNQ